MTFYKIAFNSDVMIHIYKLLSFGDQLRLAQVDANLRSIFLQYISPICYNKLTVRKLERGYYMVSNGMDTDRSWIQNSSDFEQFQQFYGSTVCDLFAYIPVRMEFFKNLVKLDCYYIYTITQDAMVQLTNNLPNLEELQVYAVEFETEPPNDCIARAIVNELLRFPKLKKLVLNVLICSYEIKFKDFYEIVTQLPLEIIEINFPILFDTDDNELELQQSPLPLMQLETDLPLLRELVVQQIVKSSCTSLQAVVTCVSSIKIIGFEHFDDILGFWFDMFSLNPQLELQLQCDVHDRNRLQYLTQHEKFPRNLRKIQIFGFTVDCSKLRNNFESVWKTISYPLEDYENDHPYRSECNIIMSRNTKLM
ncbi:uncharacterized protein isoform X3 [Musca autumnalis]|uniref:uncharacterized protein isoform X3 n=1 Tax=Musca autumnalis TaxID=221902 RepID=UPI003CEE76FF